MKLKNYLNLGIPKKITENIKLKPQPAILIIGNKKYDTEITEFELNYVNPFTDIGDYHTKFRPIKNIILTFDVKKIKNR